LAGYSVPLRRQKLEEETNFHELIEKTSDLSAKKDLTFQRQKERLEGFIENGPELQIWLKDFPKSTEDFRELRRSSA